MSDYPSEPKPIRELLEASQYFYEEALNKFLNIPDAYHYFKCACDMYLEPNISGMPMPLEIHSILPLIRDEAGNITGYDLELRDKVATDYIKLYEQCTSNSMTEFEKLETFIRYFVFIGPDNIEGVVRFTNQFGLKRQKNDLVSWFEGFENRLNKQVEKCIHLFPRAYQKAIDKCQQAQTSKANEIIRIKKSVSHALWGYAYHGTSIVQLASGKNSATKYLASCIYAEPVDFSSLSEDALKEIEMIRELLKKKGM